MGLTLAEKLRQICEDDVAYPDPVEIDQLNSDLEFILIDGATEGSDIFHKLNNEKNHGGIRMYAAAFKWSTETSGLGLAEQSAALIDPKLAAREEDIAEAIELWEDRCGQLEQHREQHRLSDEFKKVALRKILVGKTKENFDLWKSETREFE